MIGTKEHLLSMTQSNPLSIDLITGSIHVCIYEKAKKRPFAIWRKMTANDPAIKYIQKPQLHKASISGILDQFFNSINVLTNRLNEKIFSFSTGC